MINNKQKRFTLIELIIVIVVIGILAGMALPKFLGVQRDAKVSAMFRDIDTLEKTIMLYYQDNDTLPLYELDENTFNVANTLTDTLNRKGDDVSKLKVIDKSKLKNYLSKDTKYGKDKTEDDEYLYSELTGNVYYSAGLQNGKGITYHTYENANEDPIYRDDNGKVLTALKDVKIGDTLLSGNRNTINEDPNNNFTGLVKKGDTLKVEVNGVDVSSQVVIKELDNQEVATNSSFKQVKAANEEYNQFTVPVGLDKTAVNKLRVQIPEENSTAIFLVDFAQDTLLQAPDVDVDINSNPYQLVVKYPEGLDIAETQYIIDGKDTTTTKPDLTPLMDKKAHTIEVRYKTTDNKLSEWANVSFTYSDGNNNGDGENTKPDLSKDKFFLTISDLEYNSLKSIKQTSDGGYIACGTGKSDTGAFMGLVVKVSANGTIEWTKNFDKDNYVSFYSVEETSDGSFIVCGDTGNTTYNVSDALLVKFDKNGDELWSKVYKGSKNDGFTSIIKSNNGYILVGYTYSSSGDFTTNKGEKDGFIMSVDEDGNKLWVKTYGGPKGDNFNSIKQTSDGGFIIAGSTYSNGGDFGYINVGTTPKDDALILKVDQNGNKQWSMTYGGDNWDEFKSILETSDGGYILCGNSYSSDGPFGSSKENSNATIIKVDNKGNKVWSKTYAGDGYDIFTSIEETDDGGYILSGFTASNDAFENLKGDFDTLLFKIDKDGENEWYKTYGGTDREEASYLSKTKDGGYILCGYTYSTDGDFGSTTKPQNSLILKVDKNGNFK